MLTISELSARFSHIPPNLLEMVIELRNLVAAIAPDAAEDVRPYGLVYYHAQRGGPVSAGICQILIRSDHIRLAFIHGAFLPDPDGLLQGTTYPKRYVRLVDYNATPWDAVQALIYMHARFDPYTQTFQDY
jgi:hypothetical protein